MSDSKLNSGLGMSDLSQAQLGKLYALRGRSSSVSILFPYPDHPRASENIIGPMSNSASVGCGWNKGIQFESRGGHEAMGGVEGDGELEDREGQVDRVRRSEKTDQLEMNHLPWNSPVSNVTNVAAVPGDPRSPRLKRTRSPSPGKFTTLSNLTKADLHLLKNPPVSKRIEPTCDCDIKPSFSFYPRRDVRVKGKAAWENVMRGMGSIYTPVNRYGYVEAKYRNMGN